MRRKSNPADVLYIEQNLDKSDKEISKEISLAVTAVAAVRQMKKHRNVKDSPPVVEEESIKKKKDLGRSKIAVAGGSVYQLSEDIIMEKPAPKVDPTPEMDAKNGIYRG